MKIEVIGSGCQKCQALYENTQKAVASLGIRDKVFYSKDIRKIIEMGVMQSPVLAVDDIPVLVGSVPEFEKIVDIIKKVMNK